jgi:hypothetical protein
MGKHVGPALVTQKCGHEFNIATLNRWLPAGKVERHGWIECKRQADKSRIVLSQPGGGVQTQDLSSIEHPLTTTPNKAWDYGYKDGTKSMKLSVCAEIIMLSAGLLLPLLCCRNCCLCLCRGSSSGSMGVAVCRCRGNYVAANVVVFFLFFVFLFFFLLLHSDGVMVSHLFPAVDIGVMAATVIAAVILSAIVPQVETKMAPTTTSVATMNETCHGMPSTLPSDPHPREGKGNEAECGG